MTYYPDLSPYEYHVGRKVLDALNIGWLDAVHNYSTGNVSDAFVDRLWDFCCVSVVQTRGSHRCELCTTSSSTQLAVQRGTKSLVLGSAEIRVFGGAGRVYAAPNLIYHYVVEHHYRPPEEFIQAVLLGLQPGTSEYQELLEKYDLDIDPVYGVSKSELQEMANCIEERCRAKKAQRQAKKKLE
ncbi:MAG: hypothetical protein GY832_26535 [Chloroflexi bacterium]|nr:hypothetical protein [Chloroflexota bacterium]